MTIIIIIITIIVVVYIFIYSSCMAGNVACTKVDCGKLCPKVVIL